MVNIILNGKIKIPEDKIQTFISEFNQLLQNHSAKFEGEFHQGFQYEEAEIIEEIIDNV